MFALTLCALTDVVTCSVAHVFSRRASIFSTAVHAAGDAERLPFPSLLVEAADALIAGVEGVDAFLLGVAPSAHRDTARWQALVRGYAQRSGKPVYEVDALEALARQALTGQRGGCEAVAMLGGASGAWRCTARGTLERVLEAKVRSGGELKQALLALGAPKADDDGTALWGEKPVRFGCGPAFDVTVFGGALKALPDGAAARVAIPTAAMLATLFSDRAPPAAVASEEVRP